MSLYIKQKPPVINEKKFNNESVVMGFFLHLYREYFCISGFVFTYKNNRKRQQNLKSCETFNI